MARGILGGYGPDSSQPQKAGAECGGVLPGNTKDVMNYKPPQGPKGIMNPQSPGLHDDVPGNTNRPIEGHTHSGSPGLGGTIRRGGSQGRY